ncbi:MAG TPA: hypothetical protein VGQ49_05150 [Bryobacteraceae bacterium]|nr:hypothetical protein [Bryobacteraceae bacterium]
MSAWRWIIPLTLLLAAENLPAASKLAFERLALHQYEDGPLLASSYQFLPGETIWFSARIAGFESQPAGDNRNVKISWQVGIVDPEGVAVEAPRTGRLDESLRSQDKDWVPKFVVSFLLPSFVPGGTYHIPVTVKDELAGSEITGALEFSVRAESIEPAASFVIRNFRFLRNETDAEALRQPVVYKPGTTLWARFDMAGYKFEANHKFSVDYGLAVLSADGKELFTQPEAAAESKESFYPQLHVPGALSLKLDPNVPPATYTLVVTVHDKIGGQVAEQRETFRVE